MKNLKKKRKAVGLSQYQLAEISGVSRNIISLIELGHRSATIEEEIIMCKAIKRKGDRDVRK